MNAPRHAAAPLQRPLFSSAARLDREFVEFDAANPIVWQLFVRFTRVV